MVAFSLGLSIGGAQGGAGEEGAGAETTVAKEGHVGALEECVEELSWKAGDLLCKRKEALLEANQLSMALQMGILLSALNWVIHEEILSE